jgi:sugar phosphate permease
MLFQRHHPRDLGLEVDGGKISDATIGKARQNNIESRIVDRDWIETEWTIFKAVNTSKFWWLVIAFAMALYAWYAVQVHQTKYLIDIGISPTEAAFALALVGATGIIGQIMIGALSDHIGREMAWTLSLLGFLLTYTCLFLLKNNPSYLLVYVMVGLQGFIGYGLASVFGSVPAELFAGKNYGKIFGCLAAMANAGAAIGPWATGVFFDVTGSYDTAFAVAMTLCTISIFAMWMAGPRTIILVAGQARKMAN